MFLDLNDLDFVCKKRNLKIAEARFYFIYNKERNEVLALSGYQFC